MDPVVILSAVGSVASILAWLGYQSRKDHKTRNFRQLWNDLAKLKMRMDREGFKPDLIIGVPLGGLIVADLLHIRFYPDVPVMGIPLRRTRAHRALEVAVLSHVALRELDGLNILVVDDTTRSGRTLKVVTDYLREAGVQEDNLYTAVVAKLDGVAGYDVDFHAFGYARALRFPWGNVPEDDYRESRSLARRRTLPAPQDHATDLPVPADDPSKTSIPSQ